VTTRPRAPKGTRVGGRRLWAEVTERFELDAHELALLVEAVRTVDQLDALHQLTEAEGLVVDGKTGPRAHPALVESRQLRIALARLLAVLRLPSGDEGDLDERRRQRRVGARGVYNLRAVE
jgi:hypothetical protein